MALSLRFEESDEEWVPPTEEEQREMEEKRKKSDQISAELGRRMLLGWGLYGTKHFFVRN